MQGDAFTSVTSRTGGLHGYQHSYRLGDSRALFAHSGQRCTALLSLPGEACAQLPDWSRLVTWLRDELGARITRWDGAVDDYAGLHSVDWAVEQYHAGQFGSGGNQPSCSVNGNWHQPDGRGRTFYVGRREHGKYLRVYERGKQLGDPASPWVRWEIELHNKDRRIPWDVLLEPGRYAAGAYPALALAVRKAEWLGNGRAPVLRTGAVADGLPEDTADIVAPTSPLAAQAAAPQAAAELPEPTIDSPLPPAPADNAIVAQTDTDLVLQYGDRRYRVRGWAKPLNPEALKVNLLVSRGERFRVYILDLYQAKARAAYVKQASIKLGEAEDVLKHDLGWVLLKLEAVQAARLDAALAKADPTPKMDELERADALALLKDTHLLDRILADFDGLGVVGEETNKLVGYLAAVSRQLDKPLAVLIQSSSAAGKSSLMDAVLALVPDEAQVRYSAMTGQSLFYMGGSQLKHKILAIAEEEGAAQPSYALKLLQSDGSVTMASTGKDATTGLLTTHEY